MNNRHKYLYTNVAVLLCWIAAFVLITMFLSVKVLAATDNPIDNTSPVPNSADFDGGGDFTPVTGVGRGLYNGHYSWVKVYVPEGQDATVTISQQCSLDVGFPDVIYSIRALTDLEKVRDGNSGPPLAEPLQHGNPCPDPIKFHIPAHNAGTPSVIQGHTKYRVYSVIAQMQPGPGSNAERYFKINTDHGLVGIANPIDFDNNVIPDGEDYYGVYSGSGTWNYSVMFAPRCNTPGGNIDAFIKIFDADNGNYQNGMDAKLERADRDQGGPINWSQVRSWSPQEVQGGPINGASGTTGELKFQVNKAYIYKFTVRHSSFPNTIQIRLPFDQIDGDRSLLENQGCANDWKLVGQTKVGTHKLKEGDHTKFNHQITETSGQKAKVYQWYVEGKWNNDGWTNNNNHNGAPGRDALLPRSNGTIATAGGGTKPEFSETGNDFQFKDNDNVKDGDTYCQRIHFTNADGPTTPDDTSTEECVTFKANTGGTGGDPNLECKKITETNNGGYLVTQGNNTFTRDTRTHVTADATDDDNGGTVDGWIGFHPPADGTGAGSGETSGTQTKSWKITPQHTTVTITVDTQYKNGSNQWQHKPGYPQTRTITCYEATCEVVSITAKVKIPGLPDDGVLAGGDYTANVRMTNPNDTDNLDLTTYDRYGQPLGFTEYGPGINHPMGLRVNKGETVPNPPDTFKIDMTAPTTAQTKAIVFYPDYYHGIGPLGGGCVFDHVKVYEEFHLTPHAKSVSPDDENPNPVTYSTSVTNDAKFEVSAQTTSHFTFTPAGQPSIYKAGPVVTNGPYQPNNATTYTINENTYTPTTTPNAGDQYCSHIDFSSGYNHGYVGPDGVIATDVDGPLFADQCVTVSNKPYAHFIGSDVSAGGGFGDNCTTNHTGSIYTYLHTGGAQAGGSGAQFGAQALGVIEGLSSASLRSTAPTSLTGLTFSNYISYISGSAPGSPRTGGGFGLDSNCVPDYFSKKPTTVTNSDAGNINPSIGTAGAQYYEPPANTAVTIAGGTIGPGLNEAIYVKGDVHITDNITYSGSRMQPSDVQSLYIIVKGGNIYIDPKVTQLDGVFVVQQDTKPDGTVVGGKITTCSNGTSFYNANEIYDHCKKQLVVYGSFVAQKIFLDRSYSSLRYSQNGEYKYGGSNHPCGDAGEDVDVNGPFSGLDCAAEIFNYTPEVYLSQPASEPTSGPGTGKYDYITSLSPVL